MGANLRTRVLAGERVSQPVNVDRGKKSGAVNSAEVQANRGATLRIRGLELRGARERDENRGIHFFLGNGTNMIWLEREPDIVVVARWLSDVDGFIRKVMDDANSRGASDRGAVISSLRRAFSRPASLRSSSTP